MKIPGTWAPQIINGVLNNLPHIFHIQDKDTIREMIGKDPYATGSALDLFLKLKFDRRLARTTEQGEKPVPNEDFFIKFVESYNTVFLDFKPGFIEKQVKDIALDFLIAIYRVDTAYFERIGGMVSYLIANYRDEFNDPNKDYTYVLIDLYEWWRESDYRTRSQGWINWGFKFIIEHYKTNKFYFRSINFFFTWIHVNGKNWYFDDRYNPEKWFGYGRGLECNLLHGGDW